MADFVRIQRAARVIGLMLFVLFVMLFFRLHRQLVNLRAQHEESGGAPAGPGAMVAASSAGAALTPLLGPRPSILAETDITGDGRAETLAVAYAYPGRTDTVSKIAVVSPAASGYDVLLQVEGFRASGAGLTTLSTGVPEPVERKAAALFALMLTLQEIRVEPCDQGGSALGYLVELRWDGQGRRYTRFVSSRRSEPAEAAP